MNKIEFMAFKCITSFSAPLYPVNNIFRKLNTWFANLFFSRNQLIVKPYRCKIYFTSSSNCFDVACILNVSHLSYSIETVVLRASRLVTLPSLYLIFRSRFSKIGTLLFTSSRMAWLDERTIIMKSSILYSFKRNCWEFQQSWLYIYQVCKVKSISQRHKKKGVR